MRRLLLFSLMAALALPLLAGPTVQGAEPPGHDASMIERYRRSLQVDPDNPTLHYFLGVALIREDQVREGLKELRIAYPAYTDSIEMQYNMGLAFSRLGDPDSAMLYLQQAEALGALESPDAFPLVNAYYNVGLAYLENDALADAGVTFRKVLDLDPNRIEVYRLLGDIAARRGNNEEAVGYISTYLDNYPDDQSARDYLYALYFNKALKQLGADDTAGARQSFHKAYELTPDSPLVLYYLGSLDYSSGDIESAVDRLRLAFPGAPEELTGSTRAMLYNCALQLTQRQQWDTALLALEPLTGAPGARVKDLLLAGNINLQQGHFNRARELYLQVLSLEPANAKAVVNLSIAENGAIDALFEQGQSFFRQGEYIRALETFESVLAIRPGEPRSTAWLRQTRERMESDASIAFAEARQALQRNDFLVAVAHANRGLDMQPENQAGQRLRSEALDALQIEIGQLLDNGTSLLERRDYPAARAQFEKVLQLDPDNARAQSGVDSVDERQRQEAMRAVAAGNKALDEGKLAAARQAFERALRFAPAMAEARDGLTRLEFLVNSMISQEVQWGRRARSAGRLDQARNHFQNALDLRDTPEIRLELAAVDQARDSKIDTLVASARKARAEKDYPNARRLYARVLDVNPQHAARSELAALESEVDAAIAAALNTAREALAKGAYQAALASFRDALDLDPANREALAGLEKGRSKLQSSIDQYATAGDAALAAGDFAGAETAFKKVLALDPYHAGAGEALQRLEKIRLAGASPGDENTLYLRGIELYTRGKYAEAVSAWEQVLMLSPDHEKAKMNIEKARRKLEKIKEYQGG